MSSPESLTVNIPPGWDRESCESICCTRGHSYAQIVKKVEGLTAASADIEALPVKLCGHYRQQELARNEAHSCVWVGINNEGGPLSQLSAQIGWTLTRDTSADFFEGAFSNQRYAWYAELRNAFINASQYTFILDMPSPSEEDGYYLELDESSGTWSFDWHDASSGNTFDATLVDQYWIDKTGQSVVWGGEVLNFEDDMAGLSSNRCRISECTYWNPSVGNADFDTEAYSYFRTDQTEWQIQVFDDNTLLLWDLHPITE